MTRFLCMRTGNQTDGVYLALPLLMQCGFRILSAPRPSAPVTSGRFPAHSAIPHVSKMTSSNAEAMVPMVRFINLRFVIVQASTPSDSNCALLLHRYRTTTTLIMGTEMK